MREVKRVIVVRLPDGTDHVHSYPMPMFENLKEIVEAHGEDYVFDLARHAFEERIRQAERANALAQVRGFMRGFNR
jgi:hypothetical protein